MSGYIGENDIKTKDQDERSGKTRVVKTFFGFIFLIKRIFNIIYKNDKPIFF